MRENSDSLTFNFDCAAVQEYKESLSLLNPWMAYWLLVKTLNGFHSHLAFTAKFGVPILPK